MMNEELMVVLAWAAGGVLGGTFFGGLWWTVRKGVASPYPALWFGGSLLLRVSVVLAGFYVVSAGRWPRTLACLLGFLTARFIVMRLTKPTDEIRRGAIREAAHASHS
jgi:F1F0 ATPase subunit 2